MSQAFLIGSAREESASLPQFWSFKFHTSGDSDDRYVKFSFQELGMFLMHVGTHVSTPPNLRAPSSDTWGGGQGWYDRGELLVEFG